MWLLGKSTEDATYVLQQICIATATQKGGKWKIMADNNALRGHMIPVPKFGCGLIVALFP
jgi:hypothetical protein